MPPAPTPIQLVETAGAEAALAALPAAQAAWAKLQDFSGRLGQVLQLPAADGGLDRVLFGWGDAAARRRGRFHLGRAPAALPAGRYALETPLPPSEALTEALGWELARYRFDLYKPAPVPGAMLDTPEGVDPARLAALVEGAALARDLVNTPAEEMGPAQIEAAIRALAGRHGAKVSSIVGDALLEQDLNLIHAVGRAAGPGREPRLVDLRWGDPAAPKITLVGKGVAFDTGGLGIKPSGSMALMKKDMGGAANAIGLAAMIMALELPVRLRLLVPAVENSISGPSFRPGDVFRSRAGLTVEVNHTDAEGRLVLADALAVGQEEAPKLMACLATLTGAARVALGPDLPPVFTDDDGLAGALAEGAAALADPLWRMPFWDPYEEMIEPAIADLDNAPGGGMAGAITAALFLRRFAGDAESFVHVDIYGWTPSAKPGRPKGGEMQAARALLHAIETRFL
ncbi:leucyl aminopeptidase family protein [Rhodovulum sp. DZ06]|uniref:leucyl aminopeptidase family protein n=1 Tax=Rhodovulum sp. DZ06 TaxID=3425126 RepID=UPI003D33650C